MVWRATEEESDLACLMKTMQISDYSRLMKLSGYIHTSSELLKMASEIVYIFVCGHFCVWKDVWHSSHGSSLLA